MNWIIRNTSKIRFHTNLSVILEPIKEDISGLKWLISDLEVNTSALEMLPINHEEDWFLITAEEMEILRKADAQIVWGVFSGIKAGVEVKITDETLPSAEGVPEIWKDGNLQVEKSEIEIIAWDSSYTIVKFTDEVLSVKFSNFFEEAIPLEKYKWK